jgi:glycerol dehydrogenase-like iron-containing ADH family enzyme
MGTKLYKYIIKLSQLARSKRQQDSCVVTGNDAKQVASKRINQNLNTRQFVLVKANIEA